MLPSSLTIAVGTCLLAAVAGCASNRTENNESAGPAQGAVRDLTGTAWRLEDLGGAGVLDDAEATLEFPEAGKVAGRGSCNHFFGTAEISGQSIKLGTLGSTKMGCAEAIMNQETKYLQALEGAERFSIDGSTLLLYTSAADQPLRFVARDQGR